MAEPRKGSLTISRSTSNVRSDYITISIRQGGLMVKAEVELDAFASAVTGFAMQPCFVDVYESASSPSEPKNG